jgi:predicted ATPase/DNA-binding XRE family transcriptional regulator
MPDNVEFAGEIRSPFGHLLRDFRLAAGLSQEALAERAAVSADGISMLERGARRAPHRDTIELLAAALELSDADRARMQAAAVRPPVPRRRGLQPLAPIERSPAHNLPLPLTSFHGREAETTALQLSLSQARLVTLTGMGGVGKTRLALETARAVIGQFPDGVWWIELAPLTDPELVEARIAATLGLTARSEDPGTGAGWIGNLAGKCLLVALDNCEHVLDAAATIAQRILERCPGVRVLATSREALRVAGECVVRVDPLGAPAIAGNRLPSIPDLRATPAVTLFLERARLVAPSLNLSDGAEGIARWHALATICSRLDGLPLAIELAAGRMNAMSLETLAQALDRRFQVLTNGARSALPRHQTLHALVDWSFGLLGETEQRLFRRLAVFSGGWTLQAAAAVCAPGAASPHDVLATLSSLVDKSLVVADAGTRQRYHLLETMRAYALDRLVAADEFHATARRHAEYFAELLLANNAKWGRISLMEWIDAFEYDVDNLRAALGWSLVDAHDIALGAKIAGMQSRVFELLWFPEEGRRWCERALAALAPSPPAELEAPLQLALAKLFAREMMVHRATEAGLRAAALYQCLSLEGRHDDEASIGRAIALAYAGYAFSALGRYEEAAAAASESVAIMRGSHDVAGRAWALMVRSWSFADIESRISVGEKSLAVARQLPLGYSFEGLALIGLSIAEFDAGKLDRARIRAVAAAESLRISGLHEGFVSTALSVAAACCYLTSDIEGAATCARDGLSASEGGMFVHPMLGAVQAIAAVLVARGRTEDAALLTGSCEAHYTPGAAPRSTCAQAVYDKTVDELRKRAAASELETWLARGRGWSLERCVPLALEFERRTRPASAESYG